ncbi:hypothetical protein BH10ACT11_BH10ACT11_10480 [soil metagenome]
MLVESGRIVSVETESDYEFSDQEGRLDLEVVWGYLSTEAYWGRSRSRDDFEAQIASAWRLGGVYLGDRTVGFARAISDGVAFAYLADVFILAEHRGQGLGRGLVRLMIDDSPGAGFRWLLHTDDAHGLYADFGFAAAGSTLLERAGSARREQDVVVTTCELQSVVADPADPESLRLVRAMEDEMEQLYEARKGSIHDIGASPSEMRAPDGAFIVLRADGKPVAGGGLKRWDESTCEIKRMYVEPGMRGKGVSRALLEAIENQARELGYERAYLDTGDRQPAAERLYASSGYLEIPDYNGNTLARHWYEKAL